MKCCDARFHKRLFAPFRNRLSEGSLEAHQFLPINGKLLGANSFVRHSADPVNDFRHADKNLFGVASPQRTRSAERPRIDDCHLPASRAAPRRYR
jgi:hypothetical protein